MSRLSSSDLRAARIIGVLFLLTFVTSISAYALYGSVLDDTRWVVGGASDTEVRVGALPGDLDDDGTLVLARRLIREGFLWPVDA